MPLTRVEIEKFNKVLIVYNQNSGKQFLANTFARVNEVYKRLKAPIVNSENVYSVHLHQLLRFLE